MTKTEIIDFLAKEGIVAQLLCDQTSIRIVVDGLELNYQDGLRLFVIDGDERMDITDKAQVLNVSLSADFPRIVVLFTDRKAAAKQATQRTGRSGDVLDVHRGCGDCPRGNPGMTRRVQLSQGKVNVLAD